MIDTKHIFISYSRRDGESYAVLLETQLHEKGFQSWRDVRGIEPDKDFTAEIETAIQDASHVLVCITPDSKRNDSYVRREIQYALLLGKPVIPLRFVDVQPHLAVVTFEWIEFFRDGEVAFTRLCAILRGEAQEFRQQKPSGDPFQAYLETLYKRVVRFLDQAVIKLIDLTPEATPDAVNAPQRRKDMLDLFFEAQGIGEEKPSAPKPFHTFAEAFEYYEGRVLLLGEPGAGKTITLFAFARDAVAKRLNDVTAPLPLLGLISSWDAEKQTLLAEWLAEGHPELDIEKIKRAIEAGQVLLLLDGLDELGGERELEDAPSTSLQTKEEITYDPRKRFIEQIPIKNQVLMTCRVKDYDEIGEKVGLSGAVTLRPLNAEQMRVYLGEQPELWEAVQQDKDLREMLQTPLLLSFFAFAYKGMSADDRQQLRDLSKSPRTLRNKIFEHYVFERFRHEERKLDRKLIYDYVVVHQVLGHVAMKDLTSLGRENRIYWEEIRNELNAEPTEFIHQCQQLHLIVNLDKSILRFMHLRLRDYFAFDPLIAKLSDTDRRVQRKAIEALGKLGDVRAIEPLIGRLSDADWQVWFRAAKALGRIGLPAVEPLIDRLSDPNPQVQRRAVEILGQFGRIGLPAVEPLIDRLSDRDTELQRSVVEALGRIGDVRAVEPLIERLSDRDIEVRDKAGNALRRIGLPAVELLIGRLSDKDIVIQHRAVVILGSIGQPAVELLIGRLSDKDIVIQRRAVETLLWIGPYAIKRLIAVLEERDKQEQNHIIGIFEDIGTPKALEAVQKWQDEQDKKQ